MTDVGILWTFGQVYGHLVYFSCFGILYEEKSCHPDAVAGQMWHFATMPGAGHCNIKLQC
jgi:hypothetical protein